MKFILGLQVFAVVMCTFTCKPLRDRSTFKNSDVIEPAGFLESIPTDEAEATNKILRILSDRIKKDYPEGVRPARRDAHAKHHGCVKAEFEVNSKLDPSLAVGAFQPGASYKAWIRYSNGSGKDQADSTGDGRGMAIKLMGVSGPKVLETERDATTQDFLMINHPVFFVRNAADYVDFSSRSADGNPFTFFISLNPLNWHLHELSIARAIQRKKVGNPLKIQYWSMTPYMLGKGPIKFSAKPCFLNDDLPGQGQNYLRDAMRQTLSEKSACFEFLVQRQRVPEKMPVEDPTIEWDDSLAPFEKVATISIPKQVFDSKEQMDFCENMSMTPWHSLPEHRPLGGINRVRKAVYEGISKLRHSMNELVPSEPQGFEVF